MPLFEQHRAGRPIFDRDHMNQIQAATRQSLLGFPINLTFTDMKDIIAAVKSTVKKRHILKIH